MVTGRKASAKRAVREPCAGQASMEAAGMRADGCNLGKRFAVGAKQPGFVHVKTMRAGGNVHQIGSVEFHPGHAKRVQESETRDRVLENNVARQGAGGGGRVRAVRQMIGSLLPEQV